MEGIATIRVWDFPVASELCPKTPPIIHQTFDGYWMPVGVHLGIQNHATTHPKSHPTFIDFLIELYMNVGAFWGARRLQHRIPKTITSYTLFNDV